MKKFDDKFTINDTVIALDKVDILDPLMIKHDGRFYSMSKEAAKRVAAITGMHNFQFSKRLYDTASDLWTSLKDRQRDTEDVKEQVQSHSAISLDEGRILAIVPSDIKLSRIFSKFNEFISTDKIDSEFEIDTEDDVLRIVSLDKETKCGVLLTYWIKSNWLEIRDCAIYEDLVILTPNTEYSFSVDNMDILSMLTLDDLVSYSNSCMPELVKGYIDNLKETKVSLNELVSLFKSALGMKLKSDYEEEYENLLDKFSSSNASSESIDNLQLLLETAYSMKSSIHSAYLKKATTFKDLSYYELVRILTKLAKEGIISYSDLTSCQINCYTNEANYLQLELRQ